LVRAPNWIGDCIMVSRALFRIRTIFPESRIDLICRPHLASLFRLGQPIDDVIIVPVIERREKVLACSSLIRRRDMRYDLGILFTNSFSTALSFRLGGVRWRLGYGRDCRSFLLSRAIPRPGNVHQIDYYDHLLTVLDGPLPPAPERFLRIPKELDDSLSVRMVQMGIPMEPAPIIIAPGAAYGPAKCWPVERFSQVVERLVVDYPERMILCLGGRDEEDLIGEIMKTLKTNRVRALAGTLALDEALALIARAACVLANDSGLMHAAWALDVPLLAIFGPTDPRGSRPLSPRSRLIHKRAECAPCLHRRCPIDHRCMTSITVDEVVCVMKELLGSKGLND